MPSAVLSSIHRVERPRWAARAFLLTSGAVCGRIGTTLFSSGERMAGDGGGCVWAIGVAPVRLGAANIRSCLGFAAPTARTVLGRSTGRAARSRTIRMRSSVRRAGSGATRAIRSCGSVSDGTQRELTAPDVCNGRLAENLIGASGPRSFVGCVVHRRARSAADEVGLAPVCRPRQRESWVPATLGRPNRREYACGRSDEPDARKFVRPVPLPRPQSGSLLLRVSLGASLRPIYA